MSKYVQHLFKKIGTQKNCASKKKILAGMLNRRQTATLQ